mmetsp:Transcript_38575/g.110811  ORF Transcript_38575/g.110811 Transcript_38575/m.110811 type:complete len:655 (+) Transcript_38575:90-2054(+)
MAPALEVDILLETEHGVAFEVQMKRPGGDTIVSRARARLEGYSATAAARELPRLLGSTTRRGCREAFAGEHCRKVHERVGCCLERRTAAAAERQQQLAEALRRKAAARAAGLEEVRARARRHNEVVAQRLGEQLEAQAGRRHLAIDTSTPPSTPPRCAQTRASDLVRESEEKGTSPHIGGCAAWTPPDAAPVQGSHMQPSTPLAIARSRKARDHNELVQRRLEEHRRSSVMEACHAAPRAALELSPLPMSPLVARLAKARAHNESVARKREERTERLGSQRWPEASSLEHTALHRASAERREKAQLRNRATARRLAEHREVLRTRAEQLREKVLRRLSAPQTVARLERARLHNRSVAQKMHEARRVVAARAEALRRKLAPRAAAPASRGEWARRHNADVGQRLAVHRRASVEKSFGIRQREPATLSPDARAEAAQRHNEEVSRRLTEHRARAASRARALRARLAAQPAAVRETRRSRAERHNELVAQRREERRREELDKAECSSRKEPCAVPPRPFVAARSLRARRHNEAVAERLAFRCQVATESAKDVRRECPRPREASSARAYRAGRHNRAVMEKAQEARRAERRWVQAVNEKLARKGCAPVAVAGGAKTHDLVGVVVEASGVDEQATIGAAAPSLRSFVMAWLAAVAPCGQ